MNKVRITVVKKVFNEDLVKEYAIDGFGVRSILFTSSTIRSDDRIDRRSFMARMAASDSGTMVKACSGVDSCAAKRMARSIRNGSSL